jgi:hypothetical protein
MPRWCPGRAPPTWPGVPAAAKNHTLLPPSAGCAAGAYRPPGRSRTGTYSGNKLDVIFEVPSIDACCEACKKLDTCDSFNYCDASLVKAGETAQTM